MLPVEYDTWASWTRMEPQNARVIREGADSFDKYAEIVACVATRHRSATACGCFAGVHEHGGETS